MRIRIAADHGSLALKDELVPELQNCGKRLLISVW